MKIQKILYTILLMLLAIPQMAKAQTGNWDSYQASGYASGSGTTADPYIIKTAEQLAYFAARITAGQDLNVSVQLGNDIDLGAHWWRPIGPRSGARPSGFSGHFDGQGYTISSLRGNWGGEENHGFFSFINGGSVKNLIFYDAYLTNTSGNIGVNNNARRVGVLAAGTNNYPVIENIIVRKSKIDITKECTQNGTWFLVGGLVGGSYLNPKYANIYVDVDIDLSKVTTYNNDSKNRSWYGGLLGAADGGTPTIENAYVAGTLEVGKDQGIKTIGAFIGDFGKNANANTTIKSNCYYEHVPTCNGVASSSAHKEGKLSSSYASSGFNEIANAYKKDNNRTDLEPWRAVGGNPYSSKLFVGVSEKYTQRKKETSYSLEGADDTDGTIITWAVEDNHIDPDTDSHSTQITFGLYNKIRKGKVTITTKDGVTTEKTFSIFPKSYTIDLYADEYAGGTGTKDDPYLITNDLELAKLARDVNNTPGTNSQTGVSVFEGKYFKITQDIDLQYASWQPIGTWNNTKLTYFGGKLLGTGHTIKNLQIYWKDDTNWNAWGLFNRLQGKNNGEEGFASVTDLIFDGVNIEKEEGFVPVGSGINIGVVAGELYPNAEIGNIIIKHAKITDNNETYTTNSAFRVGGIVGGVNNRGGKGNSDYFRIYNLSTDTQIEIGKEATLNSSDVNIAGAFGTLSVWTISNSRHIYPTNIYVHGPAISTHATANYNTSAIAVNVGAPNPANGLAGTWYYANQVSGSKVQTYGTQKSLTADFAKTFIQQNNNYLQENLPANSCVWVYSEANGFAFGSTTLSLDRTNGDVITATTPGKDGQELYYWYISQDRKTWTQVMGSDNKPLLSHTLSLPYQTYDQYVYAILEDQSSSSQSIKVEKLTFTSSLVEGEDGTYTVKLTNNIWNDNDRFTITYTWMLNGEPVGTNSESYHPGTITSKDKISCSISITDKDGKDIFARTVYKATVVYLCPAEITINGTTYPAGVDDLGLTDPERGYSPEKPVLTWKGAYSKLEKDASWTENVIVLMGTSSQSVTNDSSTGFNIMPNTQGGNTPSESSQWTSETIQSSPLFCKTTITGAWNDVDYQGKIEVGGDMLGLHLFGDTRFENITFNHNNSKDYDIIYCQYNNLEMGDGVVMTNYKASSMGYETVDGSTVNSVQVFGGFLNDGRFYPLNTADNIKKMEASMPHGKEGFSITLKSGHFSTICVGGRQASSGEKQNGVMGTPNLPIKCTITVDIDRDFNDKHNDKIASYDVGTILAGNHEGAMYADVDIIVKSGTVARVVNGTLGNQRKFRFWYENKEYTAPYNSYMGRANILIDPASSRFAVKDEPIATTNNRVVVTELYGGSLGRGFEGGKSVDNPFYGLSTVTINGGTFKILPEGNSSYEYILSGIYGAGAGGMTGIGDDNNPTPDDKIAYWNSNKDVMLYGSYNDAKNNLIHYQCYNADKQTITDVDPTQTKTNVVIKGGVFGTEAQPLDGIYAGGSGYMSPGLWYTNNAIPNTYGGNVYGKKNETVASLTINGGTFHCKNGIFAGGRGTDRFFTTNTFKSSKGNITIGGTRSNYKELGKTYGNVELTINGGTFNCPIYGGGYGVADAKEYGKTEIETLTNMARVMGKSTVNIYGGTFYKNIYGGGDMALVEYQGNGMATNVNISDSTDIRGSVFGGGNGRAYRPASDTDTSWGTQLPDSVGRVIGGTSVTFLGDTKTAPYIYGDIYGGGNLAQVQGNTYVNLYAGNFAGQIFGGGNGLLWTKDDNVTLNDTEDKVIRNSADITGNTYVNLAQDQGGQEEGDDGKKVDNFSINVIWDKLWDDDSKQFYTWNTDNDTNKERFYDTTQGIFLNPHNIYGGGNLACKVSGLSTVNVQKGMTPFALLNTQEWKDSYGDNKNPHFYVFGGGYGPNTSVGSTDVNVDVEGDYGIYDAEIDDNDEQLARPFRKARGKNKARQADTQSVSNGTINVFDNSKGIPNFTVLGVLGGGYSGIVTGDTKVTVDGNTFIHRVYGGGFGDPESTEDNTTGQIGGNTIVNVQGAHTYGDIFGGGAGVAPKTPVGSSQTTYFTSVARIHGTTKVEISDDAAIYGNVYGGGDMANVGEYQESKAANYYDTSSLISESTLNQETGAFEKYTASGYKTFVNILGGDIYGQVFGGGKGLKKENATEYDKVGRINGNTLVHVANTDASTIIATQARKDIASEAIDADGNNIPHIWNRIYGGCAYGTVDGNTLVHIEGGMLGLNIFGGGYGNVPIEGDNTNEDYGASTDINVLNQVLGKKDTNDEGTYANILGNTKVQIDGGSWIWNRMADKNGNITKWLDAEEENNQICANLDEFKEIVASLRAAQSYDGITNAKAKAAILKIKNSADTQKFFDINTHMFKKNHNIFGGGNRACYVGTYNNDGTTVSGTGKAVVELNHSPLTEVKNENRNTISLLDCTTLQGLCWYLGSRNVSHPQFSVFGAGYGANTKVAETEVIAHPGSITDENGNIAEMDGKKYRYRNQLSDMEKFQEVEDGYKEDFLKVSREDKRRYYGSSTGGNADGTDDDKETYRRYHATRVAWSMGIPGFIFLEIHGGGCSGYVMGDTYVKTGCQLNCNNLFGAGLGWKPYGTINTKNISNYDFGSITGNSKVQINSGYFSENVYGGGAGIESMSIDNALVDFPDMARVKGKAEVHVAGKDITEGENIIGSTLVFGSIYGGGDVANVGIEKQKAAAENLGTDVDQLIKDQKYTSLVDIQGGIFYSQVFAGGNGRTLSECADYTKLGGIYGNAFIKVNGEDAYLWNRIYGGCQNGTVYGNTLVSLNEGHIASNVFGGGWGNCDTTYVSNQEVINITSANVTGNTHVLVKGGRHELTSYWLADQRFWEPSDIIDGKTYSPQYNHQTQKFKINHNIYAGGNTACLVGEKADDGTLAAGSGNTYLTLTKGLLYENTKVVPGQEDKNFFESDEWKEVYSKPGSPHFCIFGGGYGENATILGDTHVTVNMGRRGPITDFDINEDENYKHFKGEYSLMDIIGGGYNGKVEGNTYIEGEGGAFCRRVFGGGFYNSVNSTNVSIYAIDCHDIFGGGLMGDVQKSTNITIGAQAKNTSTSTSGLTNADIFIHGSIYGGNDVSGYVNVVLDKNGYFADNGGTGTHINIYGGKIDGNVYGAGNGDYLYALDKEGHTKVTVNEYYPLNPNDPESEKVDLVYTVPMRENMPSYKAASDAAKIVNINSWRPLTNKVNINIEGEAAEDGKRAIIKGDVYGGGNSATVQKVQKANVRANETVGEININIGSHVKIGRVFMGSNGDALFTASEDNDFMNKFQRLNGDIEDYTQELNLADTIDWQGDPSNKGISTLWLSTKNEERPLVYPHLLDLYFQPVETDIQGTLKWNGTETGEGLEDCTIGTFCCGGNRGNMNVYPFSLAQYNGKTDGETNTNTQSDDTNSDNTTNGDNTSKVGNAFEYTFPAGLTITDKIVGGCNNANYDYKGLVSHEGGYLLGEIHSIYPFIKLNIKNKFQPAERENAYVGGNVYGGCYKSGTIRGDVSIVLESDMLEGKSKEKLENSNELLGSNAEYSALNVYGAGYGMDSYVYGNCYVKMGRGIKCKAPSTTQKSTTAGADGTSSSEHIFDATGTSANFIYGGGQQGNVIGKTDVKVLNGHVFKSVTGGSYSGYVWGSTQIRVGYPKYYTVIGGKGGLFQLNRTDQNNKDIDQTVESGKTVARETIKQTVRLIADDVITQSVYDAIATRYDFTTHKYTEIPAAEKANYFSEVAAATPSIGWDNVNIVIGEAVYGGGYSLAQGGSVMANNTTVLKYDKDYNLDSGFDTDAEGTILKTLGGTTAGFGGNTTIVIGDRTKAEAATSSDNPSNEDRDHITISRQDMKVAELADGQDLLGYYYKDQGTKDDQGNVTAEGTYHYIYQAGTYYKGGNLPSDMEGKDVYEYDNEGGVFGDGHLSYAEGFRSADLTGYGFASSTISTPKILNTFQRLDVLRLTDNCFSLLGARDYATNAMDKTPYSISRVGEIQMYANDVVTNSGTTTGDETAESADGTAESGNTLQANNVVRSRNYMGFANNIHYVGALYSNVSWNDPWHDKDGKEATHDGKNTYQEVKQKYIDDYFNEGSSKKNDANIFEKRNDGTAKNMIGIASGYALKIQNAQEIEDANGAIEEKLYYGPVYGIIEMNLIDVREDEGGGYVYADNAHQRTATDVETPHEEDFLETTGNFVFPYKANQGRYIVDDCFPVGYPNKADAHYWYVTGFNYHYTAHITGYTLDKSGSNKKQFNSNNQDGLVTLSGLKKGQDVNILSWKMYSAHNVNDTEGSSKYECDLENRNYSDEAKDNGGNLLKEKYELYVGASNSLTYVEPVTDGTTTPTEAEKLPGFAAKLGMQENIWGSKPLKNNLPDQLTGGYAKIAFQLVDNVNNSTSDYYQKHLSKPCKGTLVLEARAFEDDEHTKPMRTKVALKRLYTKEGSDTNPIYKEVTNGNLVAHTTYYYRSGESNFYQQVEDTSFYTKKENSEDYETVAKTQVKLGDESQIYYCEMERHYTYTIDLTIDYVQGPDIEGNITIENCALPGERIRVKKDKVVVKADQAFSVNGYYWRIGKRKQNANGDWEFDSTDDWSKFKTSKDFDTYNQSDKTGKGMFAGCYYDKTEDFLEIPAYYYMNGYGIQLGITMNMPGLDDILPVKMQSADQLTIHNYHRMDPHKVGMDLHLKEAVKRVADEADDTTIKESEKLAEPRIYLADQSDLTAFIAYVDTIGKKDDLTAIQQGAHAQFVLQSDLNMQTSSHDGSSIADFAGTFHGNGHVINGLGAGNCLFNAVSGNIYNLGLSSGKISNMQPADGKIDRYHCCFEYEPTGSTPIIYRMDGTQDQHYTTEDFRLGRVAYDLNEYYLRARYSNSTDADKLALKYVYDYFANGDYQYAHRTDAITGNHTGITYLRTGKDSNLPNYEQAETRHDRTHAIDKARAKGKIYQPLFNAVSADADNATECTEQMNDFLFWGQSLQSTPADYPTEIASRQLDYMTNRVYRTAGYYGYTKMDAFHYNAYYQGNSSMSTYIHMPTTTAIDFTCHGDLAKAMGMSHGENGENSANVASRGIYYPPVSDNASTFRELSIKSGVTQNLLVYTAADDAANANEAYDIVSRALSYSETTRESLIKGHHIVMEKTPLLHLVERTPGGLNSEGESSDNNNFCAPIPFEVTNHAWYTRKPLYYANDNTGAWEGICLPFTVDKAEASLNGEITHFYGKPSNDEKNNPADNMHNLHHEYWLRGMMKVENENNTLNASFERPGSTDDGLFGTSTGTSFKYEYNNSFFVDTYGKLQYNQDANRYYAESHTYEDYLPLTSGVPYIVRFPGERYYEFDLSSKFYNNLISGRSEQAQTITFHAFGRDNTTETSHGAVVIPITATMQTTVNDGYGYAHKGIFTATQVAEGSIYGMNADGSAFDDASTLRTVMPFRTIIAKAATASSRAASSVIKIAEGRAIDKIIPEVNKDNGEETTNGDYLIIRPIGGNRVRIESSYETNLNVYSTTGQLYRILDIRPGTATYSGFYPGIYIFGKTKVLVK